GTYRLKLTAAGKEYTAPLEVKADPRVEASQADLERQYQLAVQIRDHITEIHNAVNRIREARANLEILRKRAGGSTAQAIDAAEQAMSAIEGELIQVRSVNRYAALVYPTMLDAEYANLANAIESADSAPTEQAEAVFQEYERKREELLGRWKSLEGEIVQIK